MSSSESSSTDSDISEDENMNAIVTKAFGVMKQNLSPNIAVKKQQNKTVTNKHLLIYETFKQTNNRNNDRKNLDDSDNEEDLPNTEFFIDKGSSEKTNDEVVVNDNTVDSVSINRSNIGSGADSDDVDDEDLEGKNPKEKIKKKKKGQLSSQLQTTLKTDDVYVNVDPLNKQQKKSSQNHKEPEVMKKSVISDDFEKQEAIATTHTSVRQLKKQRKLEREKTKGGKWFNMPATEITEERKYDLSLLQMRKALDPKRFYKANDLKTTPKYFQFGEVVADSTDFYSSRIPKKQRKSTIVEELLADAEFRKFNKRKYNEVQDAKRQGKGPYKHMKRLKKGKK